MQTVSGAATLEETSRRQVKKNFWKIHDYSAKTFSLSPPPERIWHFLQHGGNTMKFKLNISSIQFFLVQYNLIITKGGTHKFCFLHLIRWTVWGRLMKANNSHSFSFWISTSWLHVPQVPTFPVYLKLNRCFFLCLDQEASDWSVWDSYRRSQCVCLCVFLNNKSNILYFI